MWGVFFGCHHKKNFFFLGGGGGRVFPVSSSLLLFTLLWVYHFLGKVGLLKACDRCLCFFLNEIAHAKNKKKKKKLELFEG